ncbi:hypothetical protein ABBQ38_012783 [Trebouxia sp. C0009 RCD-2024]
MSLSILTSLDMFSDICIQNPTQQFELHQSFATCYRACTGQMTVLSDSADTFIISLEKAEADLKAIAHRLEEGFAQQYGRHQVNPFDLAQRIRRIERQLPEVHQECREVLTCKQELIDNAKSQLIGNYKALESLELRSGLKSNSGTTETFQNFEVAIAEWDSKLGLPVQSGTQDADLNQALLSSVLQASS